MSSTSLRAVQLTWLNLRSCSPSADPVDVKYSCLVGSAAQAKPSWRAEYARRNHSRYSAVFWLDGSSEDSLKQSIAHTATRIPPGQIPEASRTFATSGSVNIHVVVKHFMDWLSLPDNDCWLIIFDNVDREYRAQDTQPGAYDIAHYLPEADHGSILVTTRLGELEQRGTAGKKPQKVNDDLAKAIFRKWYTTKYDSKFRKNFEVPENVTVRFVHYTVQEFIANGEHRARDACHWDIARASITYLSFLECEDACRDENPSIRPMERVWALVPDVQFHPDSRMIC